jgi:hypothetical protein
MAHLPQAILRDVSKSLAAVIREGVFVEAKGDVDVEFHSPVEIAAARQGRRPLILVYLYLTSENPYLRNAPPETVKTKAGRVSVPAPLALDLMYLIVAFAQNTETELILIGQVKQLFAAEPVLEGPALVGGLKEAGNVRLSVMPDHLTLDQVHHVWAGFPNQNYRLSLFYTVTPVRLPHGTPESVERVEKVEVQVQAIGSESPDG